MTARHNHLLLFIYLSLEKWGIPGALALLSNLSLFNFSVLYRAARLLPNSWDFPGPKCDRLEFKEWAHPL
jgi:hypothetical protein